MEISLSKIIPEAPGIKSFLFSSKDRIQYVAGQFVEAYLPHDNPDNRGQKRWFTLASSPLEQNIRITTKFTTNNGSSYKQALLNMTPGETMYISQAMGDFVLPKDASKPLVFVAGGIGCTPMRSIVKDTEFSKQTRQIHMLYAAKSETEVAFSDVFKQQCSSFEIIEGTIKPNHLESFIPSSVQTNASYYVSGPEKMVEAIVGILVGMNIPKRQIITDFFSGY
jgi:glycine betaine catabolism B